jgi:ribonuclease R
VRIDARTNAPEVLKDDIVEWDGDPATWQPPEGSSAVALDEAMHGDRVVVRIERIKDGGRVEGRVIRILERSNTSIVGRYDRGDDGLGFVAPFDRRVLMDIFVPPGQEGGASPGDMVVTELTRWPTSGRGAIGRVAEVLGDIDAPGVDTEIIIRKHGIPDAHAPEAIAEAVKLGGSVSERDIRGRTDFRHLQTVTIDGEHARDFDDAITIEKLPNGNFWLGVHIADVSHYVEEGSALDRAKRLVECGRDVMVLLDSITRKTPGNGRGRKKDRRDWASRRA